jgi:site-specific recombinase XerD
MTIVRLVRGGSWNAHAIERELGVRPLAVDPVLSPVLTVDGFVESDATEWLAHVHARTGGTNATKTAESYAESLVALTRFLNDQNTSLRGATRLHIVRYVNYRTVNHLTRVAGTTWSRDRTVIKQFYEWLLETHGVALPITLDSIHTTRGDTTSMREGRNIAKASAAGTPLEPAQIPQLLSAAWRMGPNGQMSDANLTGARDAAFIALGLACGARANTLAHLTIYELPDPTAPGDLIEMRLPGAVSKSRREVRLPAFSRHLKLVFDYARAVGGSRRMLVKGWTPQNPIRVKEAPTPDFHGIIDVHGNRHDFNSMNADVRRRLVTLDGEPAMLFLSTRDGSPLEYSSAQELTGDVSRIAEANAAAHGGHFPHIHTHDLRHTYATHLASLFMLGVATGPGRDMHGHPHRVDVRSAIQMATTGLGHVNESTTALYTQQIGLMSLRYSVDDFLGRT